ncbi:MAG: FAD-dependent oxidoreductase [Oleispira sp.]|nr:FAD-dependent oxidoreductase [Oleispira sp.]MBL4882503.1 FAD-dependent oxidoreductase [Oleispira sp.]
MKKLLLLTSIVILFTTFYLLGGQQWLQPATYQELYQQNPTLTAAIFFVIYILVTALSIPGAALMTLIGGAVFGLSQGLLLISFASTIGATLAFFSSRLLLKDWVQNKFSRHLKIINNGIEKDGTFYLFTLRLIPLVPFFAINLLMGLMPISAWRFYWVSQLGMLAGTAVYVNAGAELGSIIANEGGFSVAGIMTPGLLGALILLAIFPWIARSVMAQLQARRSLIKRAKGRVKPKKFDDNLIVIGGGAAGLVSSIIGSAVKAKVTLIEKHKMGGDCLNTGCVPSKAIIHAAKIAYENKHGHSTGLLCGEPATIDFKQVMAHVHNSIKAIEPHDSIERFEGLGVSCATGEAKIISPWEVEIQHVSESGSVTTETRSAAHIIIATGGRPRIPKIPGLDQITYYTSDTLWQITELPKRLLVLGAGPIGCELGQAFARLGSQVSIVDKGQFLMPREDEDVSQLVADAMAAEGINHVQGCSISKLEFSDRANVALLDSGEKIEFDVLLLAIGREGNTENLGLENVDLVTDSNGFLPVDEYLQTECPTIYACGDVIGGYQFTHVSAHEAWFASVNSLFGRFKRFKADYRVIPWATFTSPEVARVGISEKEAKIQNIPYESTQYDLDDLDRAITDDAATGFVRVLTVPGKDKILGATVVGARADDVIAIFVIAMKHGLGLNKVLGTIHAYPTYMEANKFVAGEWKRKQVSERLLVWLGRFHNRKIK